MSMSLASMIEEKRMKKVFILATLVSTMVGTFTTSVGLYDRLQDRRRQGKKDDGQDSRIRELEKQAANATKLVEKNKEGKGDDLERSLVRAGPRIQQEYDIAFDRFGKQFAIGDNITQNQMQGQVIGFQQAVINVLQNAVMSGREISQNDVGKLYLASEAARDGSVDAMRQQYQRMVTAGPIQRPPTPPMTPISPLRSSVSSPSHSSPSVADTSPLFCRYSIDLQRDPRMQLGPSFWPGGSNGCPACGIRLNVEQGRAWKISRETEHVHTSTAEYDDVYIEERSFSISNRFVVKCHRENGEFACALCSKNKDKDTVCESVNGLVRHIWRVHDIAEYEVEMDIRNL